MKSTDWNEQPEEVADAIRNAPLVVAEQVPATAAHDPCSHLANAFRIARHWGDELLFVKSIGWHVWGPPWRADDLAAHRLIFSLGKIIADEAAAMAPWVASAAETGERARRQAVMDRHFKWAGQTESKSTLEASLAMAAPLLSCKAADLDANPDLLGLPSAVLDLATVTVRPHERVDRITKIAGCDLARGTSAPTWCSFINEIFAGDAELIDYVQRLAGYMLCGRRGEHLLIIFWGTGANGKSTLLGTLQLLLGEHATTSAPGLLIQRGGGDHPTGLANLQGRRLVVSSESGEAGRLNEELVKALTGGDQITARRMRQDFYTFTPSHLLVLQTNHRPRVSGTDEGIWRRMRLVPFNVIIRPERRDPKLPGKLRQELPGILAWALEGWCKYQSAGFNEPAAVRAATSEYRDASDLVGGFLSECCDIGKFLTASSTDLYRSYAEWAEGAGERPRSKRELGQRLSERGFLPAKGSGGTRIWRGLTLRQADRWRGAG